MKTAIGIVSHPQRRAIATRLADQVDAHIICEDPGCGAHRNHVRTWTELVDTDTDWTVVIEDDATPVINFTGQLTKALTAAPCDIVSLYLGRTRPPQHQAAIKDGIDKALANDASFIVTNQVFHAVALAIKTALLPDMLDDVTRHTYLPIDEAIGQWARRHIHPIAYTIPSLVEHQDVLPTLIQHRDGAPRPAGTRTAWTVGTRTTWTSDSVTI